MYGKKSELSSASERTAVECLHLKKNKEIATHANYLETESKENNKQLKVL